MKPLVSFALLWLSQCCRFFADYTLRLFVVQETASQFSRGSEAAWHTVVAIFMVPATLLPPVYGALGNTYPKRQVLFYSALSCWLVLIPFLWLGQGLWWFLAVALVSLGSSLYSPIRHAILPAAAHDLGWKLPLVMGWIEMGAILSMVLGMATGSYLQPMRWSSLGWDGSLPGVPALYV
ncbi:MAG TPA: MFS transporter, partial [Gemmatales bacterium]|nr:MFS transporter [Gemmatales bacterium]